MFLYVFVWEMIEEILNLKIDKNKPNFHSFISSSILLKRVSIKTTTLILTSIVCSSSYEHKEKAKFNLKNRRPSFIAHQKKIPHRITTKIADLITAKLYSSSAKRMVA
jgi:hypothetical protein